MKGGEKLNIATIQSLGATNHQPTISTSKVGSNTFGSVFSGLTASANIETKQPTDGAEISADSIVAIFSATSAEELETSENNVGDLEVEKLGDVQKLDGIQELANKLGIEPEQLLESILTLLQKSGMDKEDLTSLVNSDDIWFVLDAIEKVAPQFFKQLTESLEGKGEIPKQQAVELLTMLKAIQLVAPTTDLVMKQEQQVSTLQGFLAVSAETFTETLQTAKPKMQHLMESVQSTRLVISNTTVTSQQSNGSNLNGESESNSTKENVQQNVAANNLIQTPAKAEIALPEVKSNSDARNEALIKEMQNIFKRSNFGQVGGTNRLLVKLYPEHLGQVRIELVQTNGIMTARILASTALGKEMLDSQLNQLRNAFIQQNVQVDRIDVAQTLQDASRNNREQAFNEQFKQRQEHNESKEQQDDQEITFQEYMIELEA